MVSLVPNFKLENDQKVELIFLVDRSGSMSGSSIEQAKKALQFFLHALPSECLFNIFSFGSRFDSLFPESVSYTDETLERAKSHVGQMTANYGGTNIYEPLQNIFKVEPKEGFLRQIFVLTDGAVSNEQNVIALVKSNSQFGRVFSLGLGNSCSRRLVKGIARSGNGNAVFASTEEDLRPKVMNMLKNALQPAINKVKVEWLGKVKDLETSEEAIEMKKTLLGFNKPKSDGKKNIGFLGQAPENIPAIFDGSRLLVYRFLDPNDEPTGAKITAETPDGPLTAEIILTEDNKIEGEFVHQLAARKKIQDLEEESVLQENHQYRDQYKEAIIDLGKKYNLASQHTSFVGVDSKESDKKFHGEMVRRDVANQVPYGFGFGAPVAMCGGGMPVMMKSMKYSRCKQRESAMMVDSIAAPMAGGPLRSSQKKPGAAPPVLMAARGAAPSAPMAAACAAVPPPAAMMKDCLGGFDMECSQSLPVLEDKKKKKKVMSNDEDFAMECEEESKKSEDLLTDLVNLQSSSGLFGFGSSVEKALKMDSKTISDRNPDCKNVGDDVWLTVLVIKFIEMKFGQEKDLWELIVMKAKKKVKVDGQLWEIAEELVKNI